MSQTGGYFTICYRTFEGRLCLLCNSGRILLIVYRNVLQIYRAQGKILVVHEACQKLADENWVTELAHWIVVHQNRYLDYIVHIYVFLLIYSLLVCL